MLANVHYYVPSRSLTCKSRVTNGLTGRNHLIENLCEDPSLRAAPASTTVPVREPRNQIHPIRSHYIIPTS